MASEGNKHIIAAYGTLKRKYGNNWFLRDQKFIGDGTISGDYSLYALGLPFLVKHPGLGAKVELYEVDDKALSSIDSLEGHPYAYVREVLPVRTENGTIDAWVYLYPSLEDNVEKLDDYMIYDF